MYHYDINEIERLSLQQVWYGIILIFFVVAILGQVVFT